MWMFIFMILPLLAVVYIGWHVWAILPFSRFWKTVAVILLMGCFLLFFFGLRRQTDNYSLPVAQVLYERGDIDRAFRYAADHCMPDAIFYNGKLRPTGRWPWVSSSWCSQSSSMATSIIIIRYVCRWS